MTTHDPELVEQIAELMWDQHHPDCPFPAHKGSVVRESYLVDARVVLDAITTSHALVKLPEPDSTRYDEGEDAEFPPADRLAWLRDMGMYGVTFWPECAGEVQVAYNDEPGEPLSAREAKRLGAVLIAAARHAETTEVEQ